MEIKYGLISADSHAAFDRDDFIRRMSVSKWQDRIPRVVETEDNGRRVHRWTVYAKFPLATSSWPRTQETMTRCFRDVSAETREKVAVGKRG
jgi:hypothetical protein